MNSFKNCGNNYNPGPGLESLIFLLYWFRLTGLLALYMEHYCEKMNFWGCGHRKKTYGNNLFKKIAYQRLYFHPPSFVYMKDIFYVRRKEVFSCLKSEKKFQNWKSWCRSEERNLSVMRKGHNYILWGCIHFRISERCKAVYHVKRVVLVNTEIVDEYLENFRDEL